MAERFIKFYPTDESDWLVRHYGNAFILLTIIASRARRENGHPDGLIIGDALIGSTDFEPGMTRQNFRTAIEKLVEFGYIKIISNGKRFFDREKSTIKVTITGMLVNLIKLTIYDINPETGNQRSNQRPTNDQPTTNHKQERIRKKKKEKEVLPQTPSLSIPQKIPFREKVLLTQQEHDKLLALHGKDLLDCMLNMLNSYKGRKGVEYTSDYFAMDQGSWVIREAKKDLENQTKTPKPDEKSFRFASAGRTPPGNVPGSDTKFQPGRVLRSGGDELAERPVAQGSVNE
jgi:hypothetical protein